MRTVDLGETFIGHFPVFAPDGVTKQSGVTTFVLTQWNNGAAALAPDAAVAEIGTSGEYRVALTPGAVGAWGVEVYVPSTGDRWGDEFTVAQPALAWGLTAADDTVAARFAVWLERDGVRQLDIASVAAVVRTPDGADVHDLGTDSADTGDGLFAFAMPSIDLPSGAEYYLACTATRGASTWYANLGFNKV